MHNSLKMDCCILCLQTIKNIKSSLNIFEKQSTEDDIVQIIKTHFWIEPEINKQHMYICKKCWETLQCFHKFYMRIKEAHQLLEDIVPKTEAVKRRRGRPPKKSTTNESVESKTKEIDNEDGNEWDEKEVALLAEVKLEKPIEENDQEFMNLFYNLVDEQNANTTSEQPLQEISIKEEKSTENMSVDDPINELSPCNEMEDKEDSEKDIKKPRIKSTALKASKPKTGSSKHTDEFIAQNFLLNCPICSVQMDTFAGLKQHFRQEHNTRGYALCCGKKLLKRCVLVDHIQFHLNPKYFKCSRCEKVLCDRRSLEKHEENHDDKKERVFVCQTCSKSFFRRCVYQRHILLHVPAEQKTVKCPKCEKT